ncbi:MAG: FG-GAP-like repeat-containing protein [Bryobacteraceae bacterium]
MVPVITASLLLFSQDWKRQATDLYARKDFTKAAAALEQHLRARPGDLAARLLLGLCYQQTDQRARAEDVFAEAVRAAPRRPQPRFYLARVQYERGKLPAAEREARMALELGEPKSRVHTLLGLIRLEQRQYDKAMEEFREAMQSSGTNPEPWIQAGVLSLKLNRAGEALGYLNTAVEKRAESGEALYQRGRAQLALGKSEEAVRDLNKAARFGHPGAENLLPRARHAVRTGEEAPRVPSPIRFRNVAEAAGIDFTLENHPTESKHLIETMTGGVAAFDYNNDGLPDLFFVNGAETPSLEKRASKYFNRLYRNDGKMKFTDVTDDAGVQGKGYSMGAAAADFDNDGHVDLFVAGVKQNLLYRNRGNGTFEDVTRKAGIRSEHWSVAAVWLDYDRNGLLDLFVVNYVQWSAESEPFCGDQANNFRVYCHPKHFKPLPNTLYRNRGDGTFEDVSAPSGIAVHSGKGMSASFADYDGDGWPDIFVTNDAMPNFLFRNRGDGTFEEIGLAAGVALTDDGKAVSSMGTDFRDYDNDGLPDIAVTALAGETFPLFRNQGGGVFLDATYPSRLGMLAAPRSGWCVGFFDFNNDGHKDLFSANSHVTDNIQAFSNELYKLPNSVFANAGNGTFTDFSPLAGDDFQVARAHRGCAFADFDNDGRMDAAVSALGERAELWKNVSPDAAHWVRFELEGTKSNRDGIGAVVRLDSQTNLMTSSTGYASSSHSGVHFGLGGAEPPEIVEIVWPSGVRQRIRDLRLGQVVKVREASPSED